MTQRSSDGRTGTVHLIAIPVVLTLAITVLRLMGEMQGWSKVWFNPEAGGLGAIVGIVWLVPIFGIYFAMKLSSVGEGPASVWRPIVYPLIGIVVLLAGGLVGVVVVKDPWKPVSIVAACVAGIVATYMQVPAWPALGKTLVAYGFAARVPVTIIMFFAIRENWHTHYDLPPPNLPEMSWLVKFFAIGVLPQLVFVWMPFTLIIGMLFGGIAIALARRRKSTAAQAA
jgi:hypothetical protein